MGEGTNPVVVADAGPLIHLHEIGRLPLVGGVFSLVCVPEAVWDEAVTSGRVPQPDLEVAAPLQRHHVTPEQIARTSAQPQVAGLDRGELECLALCQVKTIGLLLTDDLAARDAANVMGIQPVGSLGVIVRAYHLGRLILPEAEAALEQLYRVSTLFVTRTILDLAIAQLRQSKP